ncbi:uncharacterized protein LOC144709491 [Wolffia australiana]
MLRQKTSSVGCGGRFGRLYGDDDRGEAAAPLELKPRRGRMSRWHGFWRRMRRGRAAAAPPAAYDEDSYADNFEDQGSSPWAEEPEFLARSFSAVYANPSGFLHRFER